MTGQEIELLLSTEMLLAHWAEVAKLVVIDPQTMMTLIPLEKVPLELQASAKAFWQLLEKQAAQEQTGPETQEETAGTTTAQHMTGSGNKAFPKKKRITRRKRKHCRTANSKQADTEVDATQASQTDPLAAPTADPSDDESMLPFGKAPQTTPEGGSSSTKAAWMSPTQAAVRPHRKRRKLTTH